MKMSGADFRSFITSKDPAWWPKGLYIQDEILRVNGVESELGPAYNYRDTDVVEILSGALAWEDLQKDRETPPGSLASHARRWLTSQHETRVVIAVPNDRVSDLAAILKPLGARIYK